MPYLGIHKTILDFEILELDNPKSLVFVDCSNYSLPPNNPTLQFTPPGYTKFFLAYPQAFQVTTFNSNTLGFANAFGVSELQDLPDGIWKIRYMVCPFEFSYVDKLYMRTVFLQQKLNRLYNEIDLEQCDSTNFNNKYQTIVYIESLIAGAKAAVNKNEKKAFQYYQLANQLIDELLGIHCNHCKV